MSSEDDIFKYREESEIFSNRSKLLRSPPIKPPTYTPLFDEFGNKNNNDQIDQNNKNTNTIFNESTEKLKQINDDNVTLRKNQKTNLNLNLEPNLNKEQNNVNVTPANITPPDLNKNENQTNETANVQNKETETTSTQQNLGDRSYNTRTFSRDSKIIKTPQHIQTQLVVEYRIIQNNEVVDQLVASFPVNQTVKIPLINCLFSKTLNDHLQEEERNNLTHSLNNWSVSEMGDIPIKDITDLIKEYKGDEKELNTYIKNTDKLWNHIENYTEMDKSRFLLILQLKLTEKAAEATKEAQFDSWEEVKKALKDNINPQKNIEKAELKLTTIRQLEKEDVETYAKRVEELLDNLNKSFDVDASNEIIKKENDRKARKAFENGLYNKELRDKAITRGNRTFKESVDYVTEQELRLSEFNPNKSEDLYCNYCRTKTHNTQDCRSKRNLGRNSQDSRNSREITCYKCNKKGHYASECRSESSPNSSNAMNTSRNMNETPQRSQSPNNSRNFNRNGSYNNSRSNSPNMEQRGNRDNRDNRDNRNIRLYDHEMPIEEAVVYADLTENRKN